MDTLIIPVRSVLPAGEIVAMRVSEADYMAQYAADYYEWVRGFVVKMSPVTDIHDDLTGYFRELFRAYFALQPIGIVRTAPFVMHLANIPSRREPDLQIILNSNPGTLTSTAMRGPADICIEVVSPESVTRD